VAETTRKLREPELDQILNFYRGYLEENPDAKALEHIRNIPATVSYFAIGGIPPDGQNETAQDLQRQFDLLNQKYGFSY
ncbi:MAG: hypothetical protein IE878_03705, partial [Epsilonproteobacteria bacterium]|nr:hypothetical protein [Campylobacterota bacterium]